MKTDSRVKAKWLNETKGDIIEYYRPHYHTCSACGVEMMKSNYDNYCSNCGARMDGCAQPWTVTKCYDNEFTMRCPDCGCEIEITGNSNLQLLFHTYEFCPKCGNKRKEG